MRVAIGGISHETNTFSSIRADMQTFSDRALLRGRSLVSASAGARTALGGMVDAARSRGWTLAPVLFASAMPSGRTRRGVFESLLDELTRGIAAARPLDGVLLSLHGAMASEGIDDADGEILRRVRDAAGADTPIACVLDSHANVTPAMAQRADILLAYETYPHTDTWERGAQAVDLLEQVARGTVRPVHALRRLRLLTPLPAQATDAPGPMRELAALADEIRATPDVLSVALTPGFPYCDVDGAGMAALVTADGDVALAEASVERLARACWERRDRFHAPLASVEDAVAMAMATPSGPVVLADVSDNPGAGGSGDGTAILAELLRAGASDAALASIADPAAAHWARATGVGGRGRLRLGGKVDRLHGPTLDVTAAVRWVGEGRVENTGAMGAGTVTRLGLAALLEVSDDGSPPIEVIVCERRAQTLDPNVFRMTGVDPERRKILVVKSSVHYRAAFAHLAACCLDVNGPGLSSPDLSRFAYRKAGRATSLRESHQTGIVSGASDAGRRRDDGGWSAR